MSIASLRYGVKKEIVKFVGTLHVSDEKRDQSPFSVIISSARANLKQFNVRMRTDLRQML